jgi:hypothetical protein
MRYEFENGSYVGTAEWNGPGDVRVETDDPQQQEWFEDYFQSETSFMTGPVECGEMAHERRDESEAAFTRAAYELAAYSYKVRQGDSPRRAAHREEARKT